MNNAELFKTDIRTHMENVAENISIFTDALTLRSWSHDSSKIQEPELSIFASNFEKCKHVKYGTPEYFALLEEVKPAIKHHYEHNDHHPEHHPNGIDDMDLVMLIEMLADWKDAVKRNKDGDIMKSLDFNAGRFNISPQLKQILKNTINNYLNYEQSSR